MDSLAAIWEWIGSNADAISAIAALAVPLGGALVWILRRGKKDMKEPTFGQGGRGGSASVGGNGVAVGGHGGRAGTGGNGGYGGGAQVGGDGLAIGGDGGDAGVSWRPTLGAPSTIARFPGLGFGIPHERDPFGFYTVGRGGAGGDINATVVVKGRSIPLLPLLELLRVWKPALIDEADMSRPSGPQQFWDTVTRLDREMAQAAVDHAVHCLDVTIPQGLPPPDPYAGPRKSDEKI